jgi:ribonucleoside-diphosphate reductase alpha chain
VNGFFAAIQSDPFQFGEIMSQVYNYDAALAASVEYFGGDELAAKAFLDKYALRDNEQNLLEATPEHMHRRIAQKFAFAEKGKFKNPLTEDQIFAFLHRFNKIVPQGSPMYGIGNNFQFISLSNCFVVESPADSYSGICKVDEELVQISKRRGGVGVDISNFRPVNSITHNAARTSTGIIPLMTRYSNSIREVGQNGRRGAEMQSISIHHPESVKLLADGVEPKSIVVNKGTDREIHTTTEFYDPNNEDFASVKYDISKITGANISIRLTDEFLSAVDADTDFEQRWPVESKTPSITKKISAKRAWKKIVKSAWQMAEPGLLFWDNIIRESPADCYAKHGFKTISTNPCGEIPLSAYDSCRLLLLNLYGFVKNPFTKNASFDWRGFYEAAKVAQRFMDDLIDLETDAICGIIEKIKKDPEAKEVKARELHLWQNILKACIDGRRTGTGITALGDAIAALGIAYGSDEGIAITERLYKTLKFAAYESSIEMAEELGAFPVWDHELEKNNPFLLRFRDEEVDLGDGYIIKGETLWQAMKKHGRRNIALLTTAPAGTVSIETQTTSGIEPLFMIFYTRMKKGNPGDVNFRSDFVDQSGDHWQKFAVFHSRVWDWAKVNGLTDILTKAVEENDEAKITEITSSSPWSGSCAGEIVWTQRVKLQAAAQRHVDHSISSTINLPNDATVEQVDEIYRTAWKSGCKGMTIYRDGCRTGVLVSNAKKKVVDKGVAKTTAPKRPKDMPCDVFHIKAKAEEYFVLVGLFDGDPYEVFAGKNGMIGKSVKKGALTKRASGKYDAKFDDGNELKNVAEYITDEEEAVTRAISMGLRHGADIKFVVHQLEKTRGNLFGFSKAMARALKTYVPPEDAIKKETGELCPDCGNKLIRQEGCSKCLGCAYSKCG